MTKAELALLKEHFRELVEARRALGGFDTHADVIIAYGDVILKMLDHLEKKESGRGKK